jgi:putative restriction endonuclease
VRKGWVATWDDYEKLFLVEFGAAAIQVERGDAIDSEPFELFEDKQSRIRQIRARPNQQRFKIQVIQRYGAQCAFCRISAHELVTAAHLVPASDRGTSDPRNGLPLCSNHHTALDRGLIAIDPTTTCLITADQYDATSLGVVRTDLSHLPAQPAAKALRYRWDHRPR